LPVLTVLLHPSIHYHYKLYTDTVNCTYHCSCVSFVALLRPASSRRTLLPWLAASLVTHQASPAGLPPKRSMPGPGTPCPSREFRLGGQTAAGRTKRRGLGAAPPSTDPRSGEPSTSSGPAQVGWAAHCNGRSKALAEGLDSCHLEPNLCGRTARLHLEARTDRHIGNIS